MCRFARHVLLLSFFLASGLFAAQPPEALRAPDIVRKSVDVNSRDWRSQPEYSYRELDTKFKIDASGRPKVEEAKTYQVLMIDGSPYNRLVSIENEPLPAAQEQQEEAKLKREIRKRQNESAQERRARLSKYHSERAEEHMLMQQMISAFRFTLAGEQQIGGVNCYVLDAKPNPDYRPPVERARVLTGMQGRLWIDKAQYHWVKVAAEVTSPVEFGLFVARVKPGTRFELDQAPVGDVWLPKCFTETVNASVLGLYGVRYTEQEHYSDYRQNALSAQNAGAVR